MHHPASDDPSGVRPSEYDSAAEPEVDDELSAIESELDAVDSVLEAIDRGDLDEAESTVSMLESGDQDDGAADQVTTPRELG
jgi:hypothetical protein